jgi:hypothetical protein
MATAGVPSGTILAELVYITYKIFATHCIEWDIQIFTIYFMSWIYLASVLLTFTDITQNLGLLQDHTWINWDEDTWKVLN